MTKTHARLAVALAVLAVAALGASPAPAGSHGAVPIACGAEMFDGPAALARTGTTRGMASTARSEKNTEKYSGSADGQKTPGKPTAGTIPVYMHVVHEVDGTGFVSEADVEEQIEVLNLSFARFPDGADTGFRFDLADIDWTANDAWYAQRHVRGRDRDEDRAEARRPGRPQHLHDERRRVPGLGLLPEHHRLEPVRCPGRHRRSITGRCRTDSSRTSTSATRRPTRWGTTSGSRTRSRRATSAGATTSRHALHVGAHIGLPDRQGHVHARNGRRPDPQLHGLLDRPVLYAVHGGSDRAHAEAVRTLAPEADVEQRPRREQACLPPTLAFSRPTREPVRPTREPSSWGSGGRGPRGPAQTLKRTFRTSPS